MERKIQEGDYVPDGQGGLTVLSGREEALARWRVGELRQVGTVSWYVGLASWDRKMRTGEGETFVFSTYNGWFRGQSIVYSPQASPAEESNIDLGGGWYWVSEQ